MGGERWDWPGVRKKIRFSFFKGKRQKDNRAVWRRQPISCMSDTSRSGFEFELAKRLLSVGATPAEVLLVYSLWCQLRGLLPKWNRFETSTLPSARVSVGPYLADWQAEHGPKRKRGDTDAQVLGVIETEAKGPKVISDETELKPGTVKMVLRRLLAKELVEKLGHTYRAVVLQSAPQVVSTLVPEQPELAPMPDGELVA